MAIVMMDPKQFAINLNELLDKLEMSQSELCERSQVSQATMSKIMSGECMPGLETICKILAVIPVSFERMMR
jgi:transcriptional regulator with XRE-family HTH domain